MRFNVHGDISWVEFGLAKQQHAVFNVLPKDDIPQITVVVRALLKGYKSRPVLVQNKGYLFCISNIGLCW
jgi:hypothetical protein